MSNVYTDAELMLAFFPFFPEMWDENYDKERQYSIQEDNDYYESFEI